MPESIPSITTQVKITRTMFAGLALAIFGGVLSLYTPSVAGGFLSRMDDDEYLRQAVHLKGLNWEAVVWAFTTTRPYYHPLPRLSHILDYQLWGTNATGHHATSVVVHALNAVLVFGFIWTLLGAVASLKVGERLAMALGVAVVFAIHPLQVESVAWMSGRTQLLCTTFGIGCLWAYVAGVRRWMVGVLFVLALLCKPMAVSLPIAMVALDYHPLRRLEKLGWGRVLREKAGLIVLGLVAAVVTLITESRAGGLLVPLEEVRPVQRVWLLAQSLAFYPWKLAWPAWLSPYYPRPVDISFSQTAVWAAVLVVVLVTILSVWSRRQTPALIAGWGAYVFIILPVSGLAQTGGQAMADRYAYLAMLPLLLLAGGAMVWLWRRSPMIARAGLAGLLVAELFFFGIRTRAETPVWRNDETLWRGVLAQFPNSELADELLAQALLNQGRIDEALAHAQHAVKVAPSAETHRNLGIGLTRMGRIPEAIAEFTLALQLNPNLADAHYNLALAWLRQDKLTEAIEQWEQALRIQPRYLEAHYNLGVALMRLGRMPEAMEHWEDALRIQPDYAEVHYNLGLALMRMDRVPEAMEHWERAVQIDPNYTEAHANLGVALEQAGRVEEAVGHYEQALRIQPNLAVVHFDLGNALVRLGRVPEAIQQYEAAVRLKPDYAEAQNALARLRAAQ